MLRNLLQFLTGNGTGAARPLAAGAKPDNTVPDRRESPLSGIIEQWRQAGSAAGSAARDAAGLTGNRSLQGAASGAVTAATGAGLAIGGAATGNVFLAGAGLSALISGATEASRSLTGFSKEVVEGNQRLGKWNGQIAFANARLEYGRTIREIELARATSGTAAKAAESLDAAEEAWKPFGDLWEAYKNRVSADFAEMRATVFTNWRNNLKNFLDIDLEELTKELERQAGGGVKTSPTVELLRDIVAEGERRRREGFLRDARLRKEADRPKPTL